MATQSKFKTSSKRQAREIGYHWLVKFFNGRDDLSWK
jgi:hypothetical protein